MRSILTSIIFILSAGIVSGADIIGEVDSIGIATESMASESMVEAVSPEIDTLSIRQMMRESEVEYGKNPKKHLDIYDFPYSRTRSMPDWKRLWVNTSVLVGGGVSTMLILEALPEESTAWNKRESQKIPLFKRYINHIKAGPVWDHDNAIFNFILHPYGGAAYYMSARSCGFNCWGSFLYSFCISTFFWEYGFEAFNEIPSVQDLVITPVVGSLFGEGFYLIKRHIVSNGYRLWGSRALGFIVAFLVDPVNELVGYFRGYQKSRFQNPGYQKKKYTIESSPWVKPVDGALAAGISLKCTF